MSTGKVRTQIIGAAGEVLVTYKLLKHGIDSARMTTDSGIDLVMYVPGVNRAATIQVKALWEPVPAGGKGPLSYGWVFSPAYEADWLALVDVAGNRAWLLEMVRARELAQQKPESGKWRIYWYPDDSAVEGDARRESEMAAFEIETVLKRIAASRDVVPEDVGPAGSSQCPAR
ncbi:hypothetical protein KIH27_12380 [Mycobacterium sp. M1]|uniref:DUF4365 domain-containing protein n=1 Tax=Mycolicibacter acidiphilus TaxID=2835306 RepID=A0ABS5RLM3_9MYCO|nr:hypothetical protein [Mycolicibacter acidiphilus]MBS9534381.1 hypothetical protein [Mycolicibacter acidiphilus]